MSRDLGKMTKFNRGVSRRMLIQGAAGTGIALSASGLLLPSAMAQSSPQSGGTLRVAQETEVSSLDPHRSIQGPDRDVLYQLFDTVTRFDEELTPQPGLAESWETPDPLTWIFHLRQHVTFHDGTPWDAEAFRFNIERILELGSESPLAADFAPIETIDVVDTHTAQISLSEPMVALLAMLGDRWGMMVSPTAARELGSEFATAPVGAGPFQFVEHIENDRIAVERYPDYWETPYPHLDGITWHTIPTASDRYAQLVAGDLDVSPWIDPADIDAVKGDVQLGHIEMLSLGFEDVRFNCSRPPYDNVALRQACSLGIDRQAIRDEIFLGHAEVARGPLPPTVWAANANLPEPQRDVEAARQKLAEAGYSDGISVTWDCPEDGDEPARTEMMKQQLAEIGIDVTIQYFSNAEAKQREVDGEFEGTVLYWSGRADPDMTMFSIFHSGAGYNTMRYESERVDSLTEEARLTDDRAERKALYDEAQQIVVDEAPRLFVVHKRDVLAYRASVQDIEYLADTRTRYRQTWLQS